MYRFVCVASAAYDSTAFASDDGLMQTC